MAKAGRRCINCGGSNEPVPPGAEGELERCPDCAAPVDQGALARFADRLARFGLGATPNPLSERRLDGRLAE